ncbi:hypothetical protein PO909_031450 [Leuciscus waleckii]
MSCITDCWNKEDQKRVYSCPQCRQTFTPRPVLGKNTMLAEVYPGPGDVECDVCTGRKRKAVKSCMMCLESYCQSHFECHEESRSRKRHKVTDATGRLQEMICSKHDRLMEVYCRTDQKCICYGCVMEEHKNHDTVSAEAERTEKQKKVGEIQDKFQHRIQERQKKLRELREAMKTHKRSAQAAVEVSERIFTELIRSIERRRSEVTRMIRDQEKDAVSRAEGLLKRLEQEIDDLRRREAELKQLLHTDDHIHFLQSFQTLSKPLESSGVPRVTGSSVHLYNDVRKSVSQLKDKLEKFCKEEMEKICGQVIRIVLINCVIFLVIYINIIPNYEPKTREEFLQYFRQRTLDLNTVNKHVHLSEDKTVATYIQTEQPYPDNPDRFDGLAQVLCRESVSGRCYWEVEWSGEVTISVSHKIIRRKGKGGDCCFGLNDLSWTLSCSKSRYSFCHNKMKTELLIFPSSSRIGVYVDHSAGILSFYSVSDTMTLIHTVQTTFTQPLYPGFRVGQNTTVKLFHQG